MEDQNPWQQLLLSYRKRKGITQDQLAVSLGVSLRQVVRWERGEIEPGPKSKQKIEALSEGTLR